MTELVVEGRREQLEKQLEIMGRKGLEVARGTAKFENSREIVITWAFSAAERSEDAARKNEREISRTDRNAQ